MGLVHCGVRAGNTRSAASARGGTAYARRPAVLRPIGVRIADGPAPDGGLLSGVESALGAPGPPLDTATRMQMEAGFGFDFSGVRVHHDTRAAAAAAEIHAAAFAVGQHVVFAAGRYEPSTVRGRELIGHELAHTVQQRGAATEESPVALGSELELRAAAAGRAVANGRVVRWPLGCSGLALACDHDSPAASMPIDRGDVERGYYSKTDKDMYGVRASGTKDPLGRWLGHLFSKAEDAMAYAKALAAKGEVAIRHEYGLPVERPATTAGGRPVRGNPVTKVYVVRVPAGTPNIQGVVREQPEGSHDPQVRDKMLTGGGDQHVFAKTDKMEVIKSFDVTSRDTRLPESGTAASASGSRLPRAAPTSPAARTVSGEIGGAGTKPPPQAPPSQPAAAMSGATGGSDVKSSRAASMKQGAATTDDRGPPLSAAEQGSPRRRVATAAAAVADAAIAAMPFITALIGLHQALATANGFEAQILALESVDHSGHDLGLDALPTPADIRSRQTLDAFEEEFDFVLAWLREHGHDVVGAANSALRSGGRKLSGKVQTDFRMLGDALSHIEWRVDDLDDLDVQCGVYVEKLMNVLGELQTRSTMLAEFARSNWALVKAWANFPNVEDLLLTIDTTTTSVVHRLGALESALQRAIGGYRAERTKARIEGVTLRQLYNVWRPLYLEILREQGADISASRRSLPPIED